MYEHKFYSDPLSSICDEVCFFPVRCSDSSSKRLAAQKPVRLICGLDLEGVEDFEL